MADVASRYDPARHVRSQLTSFRIRELKDVLARLGLPKQGKKQILLDKIMELIVPAEKQSLTRGLRKKVVSREEAIAIIDEEYRKLRNSGTEVTKSKAARSGSSSGTPSAVPKPTRTEETKTRCPCGSHIDAGIMIQCDDPKCRVWQHMNCVVHPEKPTDGAQPEIPPNHFCELCRINRGDPFCVTEKHTLNPMKLLPSAAKTGGSNQVQNIQKSFYVNATDRELLRKPEYDLQVWCVLLSDKVSFRNHWPSYADLKINGESVRVTSRPGGPTLLGLNGRDEAQSIKSCMKQGLNMFMMSAFDTRPFCLGVRLIRRLSLDQVMNLIPSEADGEPLEEAMARVRRCINGGGGQGPGGDDDGSDSDLEVMAEYISVNLRCPMSGSRIKVAGRFKPCLHMGCFDLDTYVELNQRARKWQCPICLKNYSIEHLIIDPFFNRITNTVKTLDDEITEVELKADGSWRPKPEGRGKNGEPWRPFPGAAKTNASAGVATKPALFSHHVKVEQELSSHDIRLQKSNFKQRLNGGPSQQQEVLNVITRTRSTSATDSNLKANVDERSVNQDPSERNVVALDDNDEAEISSRPQPASGAANPIILSDSDDEGAEADVEVVEDDDDEVVGSSYAESDARVQSPDHDSSRLALGLASTAALPYDPLNNRGLGLQLDTNSVWTAASNKYHRPHLEPPVRPTPVQATGNGFLSGRSRHEATTTDVSVVSDTTASPLQEFLPAQPAARAEVSELSRGPLYIDNSWFSLSLGGGGKDMAEPAPARSIRASSVERFPPFRQPRVPMADINSRGLHGRNGNSLRLRPPVGSHYAAVGHPFPVRPRSSPMYAARRVHRPMRVDDSDVD